MMRTPPNTPQTTGPIDPNKPTSSGQSACLNQPLTPHPPGEHGLVDQAVCNGYSQQPPPSYHEPNPEDLSPPKTVTEWIRIFDKELKALWKVMNATTSSIPKDEIKELHKDAVLLGKSIHKTVPSNQLQLLQDGIEQAKQRAEDWMNFLHFRIGTMANVRDDAQSCELLATSALANLADTDCNNVSYLKIRAQINDFNLIKKRAAIKTSVMSKPLRQTTRARDKIFGVRNKLSEVMIEQVKSDMKATKVLENKVLFKMAIKALKGINNFK